MHRIPQPSISINDVRTLSVFPQWESITVGPGSGRADIVHRVVSAAGRAPGGKLRYLIIHCHGGPAFLQLGEGFDPEHMYLLRPWRGLIGQIWIHACRVSAGPVGHKMCQVLAQTVGCVVKASTYRQFNRIGASAASPYVYPSGVLDEFEGDVKIFGADGTHLGTSHHAVGIDANDE